MADEKITELTELTALASGDLLVCVDDPSGSPVTKKITIDNLLQALALLGITSQAADPDYIDGQAIIYFYSSGGTDELRVRGKVGATETQVVLADITP